MKDWTRLNSELRPLEQEIERKYGIRLGDERLRKLMAEIRPDAYGQKSVYED